MIAEFGVFLLILALLAALFQTSYLWPVARWRHLVMPCLTTASWLQALCMGLAFACLIVLRLNSDFTVSNVIAHSNLSLPSLYKITGSWGNHEGSMLLWASILAVFGALLAGVANAQEETTLKSLAMSIQSTVFAGFLLFILSTSNPFNRQFPPAVDGNALNPLLQDVALSIHPPMLYIGYVGFSIVFALAVAALVEGKMGRAWAMVAHPWIMVSWSALTLGIGLGSWWAYRELGWGGWWFWDPVENCSLLPWLAGTALLHANIVLKKRGLLKQWVLLLAILTFGLSLLGTFLVRSGLLTSVHSFASDPQRGLFILAYIVIVIGGALLLYSLRAARIEPEGHMDPRSREGLIIINNLFVLCACATVLLGTLYPMFAEWMEQGGITVGAPYFNRTFVPMMAVPLFLAGFSAFMPWQRTSWRQARKAALPGFLAVCVAVLLVLAYAKTQLLAACFGFGLAAWLGVASVRWLAGAGAWRVALPVFVAHMGAAVLVAGITGASLWKQEAQALLSDGDSISVAGYTLGYQQESRTENANYHASSAELTVADNKLQRVAMLYPEYRVYDIQNTGTSEADIVSLAFGDLYAVIGATDDKSGKTAVRVYYTPMIQLLWGGFVLMALGGFLTLVRKKRA